MSQVDWFALPDHHPMVRIKTLGLGDVQRQLPQGR
jgi:hypothetical protein